MDRKNSTHQDTTSRLIGAQMNRRTFLRRTAAGAGAAALLTLGHGSLGHAAGPVIAGQAPPPGSITRVEAGNGSVLFVEPVVGRRYAESHTWRPTGHIYVRNVGAQTLTVTNVTMTYEGASAPTAKSRAIWEAIAPGKTAIIAIPEDRLLPFPLPDSVNIKLDCAGYLAPVSATFPIEVMDHHTTDRVLPFPMKQSDCAEGVYLATGSNHGFDSSHGKTRSQRFAYDFHARRWTGSGWSTVKAGTDGSNPEDYLIWGQPVYAVANAKIVAAWRDRTDDAIGVDTSPGGNGFWMRVTGGDGQTAQYILYAHLMQGSIPPELVPVEGGPGPNVTKGQLLGLVGKSGTKKPHLHFHLQRGISKYVDNPAPSGEGLPIRFPLMAALGFEHFDPDAPDSNWKAAFGMGIAENCLVNAEAPGWVGPVKTAGLGVPGNSLAIPTRNPGFVGIEAPGDLQDRRRRE